MAKQAEHSKNDGIETDQTSFIDASQGAKKKYGRFNLLIVGRSGVGKSSLVNAVFGRDLARVGVGLPVTQDLNYYSDDTLGVWDSEGFELGSAQTPVDQVREDLARIQMRPRREQISVVWYCIDAGSTRLLHHEIETMRTIEDAGLPVILVLTKVKWSRNPITGKMSVDNSMKTFWEWLKDPLGSDGNPIELPVRDIIPTSVLGHNGKGKGYGLSDLVSKTLLESPDDAKDAFRIAQRLNLPWKREMARKIIGGSSTVAAVAAATPIPLADATVLAPIQLTMMGKISIIYELEMKAMVSVGTLAQVSAQFTGRSAVRSLVKFLPGVGNVINAAVASALTGATGEAWMRLCEQIYLGKIDIEDVEDHLKNFAPGLFDLFVKYRAQEKSANA